MLNVLCNTTYQERQRDWPYEALATYMKIKVLNPASRFIGWKDELEREFYSNEIGSSSDLSEELFYLSPPIFFGKWIKSKIIFNHKPKTHHVFHNRTYPQHSG